MQNLNHETWNQIGMAESQGVIEDVHFPSSEPTKINIYRDQVPDGVVFRCGYAGILIGAHCCGEGLL